MLKSDFDFMDAFKGAANIKLFKLVETKAISKDSTDPFERQLLSLYAERSATARFVSTTLNAIVHQRRAAFTFSRRSLLECWNEDPQRTKRRQDIKQVEFAAVEHWLLEQNVIVQIRQANDHQPGAYMLVQPALLARIGGDEEFVEAQVLEVLKYLESTQSPTKSPTESPTESPSQESHSESHRKSLVRERVIEKNSYSYVSDTCNDPGYVTVTAEAKNISKAGSASTAIKDKGIHNADAVEDFAERRRTGRFKKPMRPKAESVDQNFEGSGATQNPCDPALRFGLDHDPNLTHDFSRALTANQFRALHEKIKRHSAESVGETEWDSSADDLENQPQPEAPREPSKKTPEA